MENNLAETSVYSDILKIIQSARTKTRKVINSAMVESYWMIGKRIVEEEQKGKERAEYGQQLIKNLSVKLNNEFGKGFSIANLKNIRKFYLTYLDDPKGYTLCSFLSWSHNRLIMRIEYPQARLFYLKESKAANWSVRQLQRNIDSQYFQRTLSTTNQENSPQVSNSENTLKIKDFFKDPYVLEFLNLSENNHLKESHLEHSLINNLQSFLLELGKGFCFVDRQFRISTETSHFYIDLVFYNYLLKCFVIIDLKTTKLTHQDIGQMDMYVRMFDDLKRGDDDNPTIGIILCKDKDHTLVKYSVLKESEQLFASKYRLVLPTEKELEEELAREIRLIEGD